MPGLPNAGPSAPDPRPEVTGTVQVQFGLVGNRNSDGHFVSIGRGPKAAKNAERCSLLGLKTVLVEAPADLI